MRRDPESGRFTKAGPDERLVRRSGMLRKSEQRQDGDAVSIEFLIAFTRNLIRVNPGSDALYLAMYAAAREVGITNEQASLFKAAIVAEQAQSPWPEGFFG